MTEIEDRGQHIEEPDEPEEQESKPLSPLYKWAGLVMVVIGLGVGAFFLTAKVILPLLKATPIGEKMLQVKQKINKPKKKVWKGPMVDHAIQGVTVNAAGPRGLQFVTFDLNMQVPESAKETLVKKENQIRGALIAFFVERTVKELSTREFHNAARDTMRAIINSVIEGEPVDTAYFTRFLIQ